MFVINLEGQAGEKRRQHVLEEQLFMRYSTCFESFKSHLNPY